MKLFDIFKKKHSEQVNNSQCVTQDYTVSLTDHEKRLLLECEYCGRPVCFYDDVAKKIKGYDAKETGLKGKRCCGSCYKKLFPTSTEKCSICKNTVPLSQIFHFKWKEYCSTCWEKELNALDSFYDRYTEMLTRHLLQNNKKIATVQKERNFEESEVLYKISNSQMTVAFTCNQRIKITSMLGVLNVQAINEKLLHTFTQKNIYDILSVQLSGNAMYILTQLGVVFSLKISATGISISEEENLFLPKEELLFISSTADTKAHLEKKKLIADRYYAISFADKTYYDTEQNCFFRVYVSGSYHDGYDVDYGIVKKEKVLEKIQTRFTYYIYASEPLYNGELSLILSLPENDEVDEGEEINPTPEFERAIYGIEYI